MAWKEFKYSYISGRHDLGYRPYIKVIVEINGEHLPLYAIIDSGAQDTILNVELAPIFNLNVQKFKKHGVGGIGGDSKPGYETTGILTFPDMHNVRIESPLILANFPADMILGQNNFFKNFNILFEGRAGIFKLNKIRNYTDER